MKRLQWFSLGDDIPEGSTYIPVEGRGESYLYEVPTKPRQTHSTGYAEALKQFRDAATTRDYFGNCSSCTMNLRADSNFTTWLKNKINGVDLREYEE